MRLQFRPAVKEDLPGLIAMLADDALGVNREEAGHSIHPNYIHALKQIENDPNNDLIVAEFNGQLVGMIQLTFIASLTRTGALRCQIEGIRVDSSFRGRGFGSDMIRWGIEQARKRDCRIVQLTSDKKRMDALQFYKSLGFTASHEGFKLAL